MPRKPARTIRERPTARGLTWNVRFPANGQRHSITFREWEGWTRDRVARELAYTLEQVRRGVWQPPLDDAAPLAPVDPTFREFASDWFQAMRGELAANTVAAYEYQLTHHLLPFFADHRLSQITVARVDDYRAWKVKQARVGAETINKTITRLGQILDVATERELIARNPVRVNPRNRKLRVHRPARPYLDRAQQIAALLEAGDALDEQSARLGRERIGRRAMLATLTLAGLRAGELCVLRWRDVDLAAGRLTVGQAKTDAGVRTVQLLPLLRDELAARKARLGHVKPDARVFATASGGPRDRHNIRERAVKRAADLASERLVEVGGAPLPKLTPHALRRTFASVLVAAGRDPAFVMSQMGHTDPALTLRVYAQVMRQDEADREALRALVDGGEWGRFGTNARYGAATT